MKEDERQKNNETSVDGPSTEKKDEKLIEKQKKHKNFS